MGIDWLRVVGPHDLEAWALGWMIATFGDEFEAMNGVHRYSIRLVWPGGAQLWIGHASSGGMAIELPGDALASVDADTRVEWCRAFRAKGFRATRIDLAIDARDAKARLRLVQDTRDACEARQLCRFRVWDLYKRTVRAALAGQTVYLGRRGDNGSGKVVRVYDKGLEQTEKKRGRYRANEWHRWEAEFSQERADAVFAKLCEASDAIAAMGSLAVGVADFREVNGRRELARRQRCAWFAQFVEAVGGHLCPSIAAKAARLASCVAWIRRCVAPTLAGMAADTGMDPREVFAAITEGVEPGGSEDVRLGWRQVLTGEYWKHQDDRISDLIRSLVEEGSLRACPM